MATFLELCQDLARETGIKGTESGNLPASVAGQVGELGRLVGWVQKAWLKVQGRRHWNFLWEKVALTLPLGSNVLVDSVPAERYVTDSMQKTGVPTSSGVFFDYVPWDDWADWYSDADIAAGGAPTAFTVRPDNAIVFNGIPNASNGGAVAFTVERYRNPQPLVLNTDVPLAPVDLHDLIVLTAMVRYANFDEAGSMRATAADEMKDLERDLIRRCLPTLRLGGPLTDE